MRAFHIWIGEYLADTVEATDVDDALDVWAMAEYGRSYEDACGDGCTRGALAVECVL